MHAHAQGSINKFRGQHPLRDRARKLHEGILVIRFEMPFNVWCEKCNNHIGKGVRYNAEKKKVGNYYSTPIYSFGMKCHLCDQRFVIETDPKACDYKLVSGVKKKNEEWEPEEANVIALAASRPSARECTRYRPILKGIQTGFLSDVTFSLMSRSSQE